MIFDPQKHHRCSIRLKGYDYSQPGWYLFTICTQNRMKFFGDVVEGQMVLNDFGKIAENNWLKTEKIRKNIIINQYVIMPNHLHGIIGIVGEKEIDVRANCNSPQLKGFRSPSKSIGAIIRGYKGSVTKKINILLDSPGASVWQINFFERIIRNESELIRIRNYIIKNPLNWSEDKDI